MARDLVVLDAARAGISVAAFARFFDAHGLLTC